MITELRCEPIIPDGIFYSRLNSPYQRAVWNSHPAPINVNGQKLPWAKRWELPTPVISLSIPSCHLLPILIGCEKEMESTLLYYILYIPLLRQGFTREIPVSINRQRSLIQPPLEFMRVFPQFGMGDGSIQPATECRASF